MIPKEVVRSFSFVALTFWLLSSGIASLLHAESHVFSTIAGLPLVSGYVNGTNSAARFNYPQGIAMDSGGNIFVSEQGNTIRRIHRAGTNWVVTTIVGQPTFGGFFDGTNTDARFNGPDGLTIANDGALYVADVYNHVIRRATPSGTNWVVTTIAGSPGNSGAVDGTNSTARFNYPVDVVVDADTNVFVADYQSSRIRKIAPIGTNWAVTTIAGSNLGGSNDGTNQQAGFANPQGITIDNSGNLYVTDKSNNTIRKLAPIGTNWVVTTIAGSAGLAGSADGTNAVARFFHPYRIRADRFGTLYVSDGDNHTLRRITPSGTNWIVTTLAGLAGSPGTNDGFGSSARFYFPVGLALDVDGGIFVADLQNYTIRFGEYRPTLGANRAANSFVVTWPQLAGSYSLERCTNLDSPGTWTRITNGIGTLGNDFIFIDQAKSTSGFYRLRK